jgi:transposase Tn5 family protein/transposase-like protein
MESKWAQAEMSGARVWDPRCRKSLATIVERLTQHPEESLSHACGSAARQAAHRIFEHPSSTPEGLLQGHFAQTARRCAEHPLVLAVQDSTEFDFTRHQATADLGPLGPGRTRGLMGHSVLAVTPEGLPLGLLHLAVWARDPEQPGQKRTRRQRRTPEKESQKWLDGLTSTEAELPPEQAVLVVADREADVFAYLAAPRRPNTDLLVRACQPRLVTVARPGAASGEERASLLAVAKSAAVVGFMTVRVPRRPGRPEHEVTLQVRATTGQIQPPRHRLAGEPDTPQAVSILCATEVEPPVGEEPIQWILVTTRGISSADAAYAMVRYYARRWVIERWHYTLKSGCRVERLQIDDAASLKNALGVYGVVAWRLLWMTHLARVAPEQPAAAVVELAEQVVLEEATGKSVATVREAVRAIAKLGGFAGTPAMGEPGVKSLWLGWRQLEAMVAGYRLALQRILPMIHD